jgi:hypothetical protein
MLQPETAVEVLRIGRVSQVRLGVEDSTNLGLAGEAEVNGVVKPEAIGNEVVQQPAGGEDDGLMAEIAGTKRGAETRDATPRMAIGTCLMP